MAKISLDMDSLKNERADLSNFLAQPDAYNSPDFKAANWLPWRSLKLPKPKLD